jgi:hypothetical protein
MHAVLLRFVRLAFTRIGRISSRVRARVRKMVEQGKCRSFKFEVLIKEGSGTAGLSAWRAQSGMRPAELARLGVIGPPRWQTLQ